MSKGLQALKSLEKIVSKLYGMDIAYDEKTFNLFHTIGKELQALKVFIKSFKCMVYHARHNNTGYEMCIEDEYGNFVYHQITQEEYELLKEVML